MPSATVAVDDKETKEFQPLVERATPAKPWFTLYGWIEAGITGNPTEQFKPFAQNTSRDKWTLGLDLVMEAAQENA
jgi:hypothetical protein